MRVTTLSTSTLTSTFTYFLLFVLSSSTFVTSSNVAKSAKKCYECGLRSSHVKDCSEGQVIIETTHELCRKKTHDMEYWRQERIREARADQRALHEEMSSPTEDHSDAALACINMTDESTKEVIKYCSYVRPSVVAEGCEKENFEEVEKTISNCNCYEDLCNTNNHAGRTTPFVVIIITLIILIVYFM